MWWQLDIMVKVSLMLVRGQQRPSKIISPDSASKDLPSIYPDPQLPTQQAVVSRTMTRNRRFAPGLSVSAEQETAELVSTNGERV